MAHLIDQFWNNQIPQIVAPANFSHGVGNSVMTMMTTMMVMCLDGVLPRRPSNVVGIPSLYVVLLAGSCFLVMGGLWWFFSEFYARRQICISKLVEAIWVCLNIGYPIFCCFSMIFLFQSGNFEVFPISRETHISCCWWVFWHYICIS